MNEMVTITKEEYQRLIMASEDLEDIKAIDDHRRKLNVGEEESVPSEFVDRMLAGESLVKLWRKHRGLSQSALSKQSSVNRVQIVDIEAGRKQGSIATIKKLAEALDLTVDDLV